jgi:hypothetical protein
MNEQLMLFEGQEIKVKTDNGVELFNLANSARACGLYRKDDGRIFWKGNRSIYDKLSKIRTNLVESACAANVAEENYRSDGTFVSPSQYINELDYILKEIEETDNRNAIYMSRYLTSMLAMSCNNVNATQYKSWLAQLDEKYSNGELQNNNQLLQLNSMANQINLVANTMTQIGQAFTGLEQYVRHSIQAKDGQIDDIKSLIGFRSSNTKRMVNEIKDRLSEKLGRKIFATSQPYKEIKLEIFKEFKVLRWEEIPVEKYNSVYAFIDEVIECKYSNSIIGGAF